MTPEVPALQTAHFPVTPSGELYVHWMDFCGGTASLITRNGELTVEQMSLLMEACRANGARRAAGG